ncbi:SpoIVB peptidase [Ruminococcus sp.]|uniref:SpoIVB peptidase n=1 Tax=Ruminococcus sp. TaxID=41978 RepID=UPI0025ED1979|nr:SpoIVB peptidase [Ruminococcus sp.]MCR4640334.1 SpoIVB peptidase [Ruminococcus sp.]
MFLKRKFVKSAATLLFAAFVGLFGTAGYYSTQLPAVISASSVDDLKIAGFPQLSCSAAPESAVPAADTCSDGQQVTFSLFGAIPVKNVEVRRAEAPVFAVGGRPFGIKLLMEGVMVTGLGGVEGQNGSLTCPAEEAGLRKGDIIRLVNGEVLTSNDRLQQLIADSGGKAIELSVRRGDEDIDMELKPVLSCRSGGWKGGMWVRDSIAGIGTMSFFDTETGCFAGLGHPICDSDTGRMVPVHSGEAVPVEITEVKRGARGLAGELRGKFAMSDSFGTLEQNKPSGIYGRLNDEVLAEMTADCEEFPMAFRQEITEGEAEIYTTVSGDTPERYSAEIVSVDYSSGTSSKNMVIRITDQRLIDAAGGIVQGMSGSPIIQNGKLIGAVTHVFVGDPSKGYGIFAENMACEL